MIRSLYYTQGKLQTDLTPQAMAAALQDPQGLLWVDMDQEPPYTCEPLMQEVFGFHPLAIADALEQSHVPKSDDWGSYLYLVLHAVGCKDNDCTVIQTLELDLFLGSNYVVTYQAESLPAVDRVWMACNRDVRHLQKGAWHLLYQLADEVVSDYMPIVEDIDATIDDIEDQVFGNPEADLLERIFALKRALLHLRRITAPQREVLNRLSRGDYAVIPEGNGIFFHDVYDHLVRLYDLIDNLRDLVSGVLDSYLSLVSNRMNEVMKTLTVITTIFMPISFLAGFFGMNFFQPTAAMDPWTSHGALRATLIILVMLPLGMYFWMRKRAWM